MKNVEPFFKPSSIAIVGASNNQHSIGGKPIHFLKKHGFSGKLFPVNPKYGEVQGIKCYNDVLSLPEAVDVVMLIVKAENIIDQVKRCNQRGIKNVLIVSSGYAELGKEGLLLQSELINYCKQNNMSLIGPNSQGVVSLMNQSALSFSASLERESLILGDIGFISQSGAFGNSVFSMALDQGFGFAYNACTGNEAMINTFDLIEWMLQDKKVKIIACYNEGFDDSSKLRYLSSVSKEKMKPIIWFKAGKSELGKKAAISHTGSISGDDDIFNNLIKQYGMLRINDIHELFDTFEIFKQERLASGTRVGVLTTSGGTGVMLADELQELNVEVPELSNEIKYKLSTVLPAFASLSNPIDITAQVINQPELFKIAGEVLIQNEAIDVLCISLTMVIGEVAEKIVDSIIELNNNTNIPLVVSWTISEARVEKAIAKLKENKIPLFQTPVRSAKAIHKLLEFSNFVKKGQPVQVLEEINSPKTTLKEWLDESAINEFTVKKALGESGLPITKEYLVQSEDEAIYSAKLIGYPVVLKVVSEEIHHKTEVGGVILNISNEVELITNMKEMKTRLKKKNLSSKIDGFLIQEMAQDGLELILGITNRKPYGPIVSVGLGGIWVEVLKDITYRQAPINIQDAKNMLTELKAYPLLKGARGSEAFDIDQLSLIISKFSYLTTIVNGIEELEINPLIISNTEMKIVDALCIPKT